MRFIVMFVTAVCVLFLIKLRWPKRKNFYVMDNLFHEVVYTAKMISAKISFVETEILV